MTTKKKPFLYLLRRHRHSAFYRGGLLALCSHPVFLVLKPQLAIELSAIIFFVFYLGAMARRIPGITAERLKTSPQRDDAPTIAIPMVSLIAVAAAVAALFNALNRGNGSESVVEVGLAFASVIGGWFTIHVMFAMHYAHRFWQHLPAGGNTEPHRGLDFPQTDEPGAYEFLYFSLVIGMTAQTSDVAITSTPMRCVNILHAITSFFFNTILVAAAVNAAVALAG